ncbi:MAG: [protein-PII] uridylyltransferase [Alphaproteobacteria bacterium]|nr:[protein-PII] uridylyltransferase [Alphaproteobacteria bacterium]
MDRNSFKSGFTLFNKKKENLQNTSNKINQNSLWVQSLEPIKYAKNCSENLYKIDDFKTETNDLVLFKKELFSNLKNQLDEKNDLIKKIFLGTSDGSLNVGLNSILIDSMLRVVFKKIYHKIFNNTDYIFSIIAVGGYGRGELAPCSDLDLLFLLPNNLKINESKHAEEVIQFILYILWDLGYSVGHSTRTIDDCIEKSKLDLTISTALLEKRFIVGNEDVFSLLNDKFTLFIKNTKTLKFVEAKLVESELRHKRFGGSRYVVEPNVKDGKGGLRDLHTLIWISKFAYKVDSVSKLINMGALSKKEAASFAESQRFLLSVRCHLHYRAFREDDRLAMDAQLDLAKTMNFKNTITQKDVERFMKRYFLATKTVGSLTRIFCAAIETEFDKPLRLSFLSFKKKEDVYPFDIELGRLFVKNKEVLSENPVNIIKLFNISHNKNIDIHPKTLRYLTSLQRLINYEVRNDFDANKMFLDILTSDKDSTRTLRLMNESNILGKFIPEFQKIVGLMQFDMYHSYTVDEHTIFTISNLYSLKNGEFKNFAPLASKVILEISSKKCLFVAMLLHDIAKGRKGDHSENGSLIASVVCPRLGLSKEETKTVEWLILYHLLMSKTAFRYELGDARVIKSFVDKVKSVERLKLLLVLTVADIKGVGPEIWNDWKGSLITELYSKSFDMLQKDNVNELIKTPKKSFENFLVENGLTNSDAKQYCSYYYDNYWEIFNLSRIINHYEIFRNMYKDSKKFKVHLFDESKLKATELLVIAPDHHGLFSLISGLVSASGYDVVNAKIITRSDGYALDTFFIQNKNRQPIIEEHSKKKLLKVISQGLEGNFNVEKALNKRWEEIPARFRAIKAPTRVIIDNNMSDEYSILEIKCKNAPGVLYRITKVITSLGLQINTANVSTYGDRVVDIFYIKDAFGSKIDNNKSMDKVKMSILKTLEETDPANQMTRS